MSFKNRISPVDHSWAVGLLSNFFVHCVFLLATIFLLMPGAQAQVGIGFQNGGAYQGTIGHNKGSVTAYTCPSGTVLRGLYHVDKSMTASARVAAGMTSQVGLYCGTLESDSAGNIVVNPSSANGTPTVLGAAYREPGTARHGYCDSGAVVARLGGYDRQTSSVPWSSSLEMTCRQASRGSNDWVEFPTGSENTVLVGVNETNATQVRRGPFCGATSSDARYTAVTGIHRQAGGEGYDGINVYCGSIVQARHSAYLEFTNYAWNKSLGGSGWNVRLERAGVALPGQDYMTPWSSLAANNRSTFTPGTEVYVRPNTNYGARISRTPSGTNDSAYVVSGNCANGISLSNLEDYSCGLMVTGKPDLAVHIVTPENPYEKVNQSQVVNFRAVNMGPAAVNPAWGYAFEVTIPAGWQINDAMPSGCAISGSVLTCQINKTLAGSSSNGAEGGELSYALNFTTNSSVVKGSYAVPIRLLRSIPDASGDATRKDYNTNNDTSSDFITYLPEPNLTLLKITKGGVGSFNFNFPGQSGPVTETITTVSPGTSVMGKSHSLVPNQSVVVTEVPQSGLWEMESVRCVNPDANGGAGEVVNITPNLAAKSFTIPGSYVIDENDIVCTVTNQQQTIDTSKKSNYPNGAGVLNGDVITYTLTTVITGMPTRSDIVLTDTLSAGLVYEGIASQTSGSNYTESRSGQQLRFTLPAGAQPGTHSISYTAKVNTASAGSVSVNNSVTSNIGTCVDCSTTNPVVTVVTSKTSNWPNGAGVQAGDYIAYTLTTVITGGPSGKDIVLTDTLGPGLHFDIVSQTGSFNADVSAAPVLKFTLPAGTPAGSHSVTYQAIVESDATTTVSNQVSSDTGACPDCTTTNPIVTVETRKSTNIPDGTSLTLGQEIIYTLSVVVSQGNTTHDLVLTDTMDPALQFQSIVGTSPFAFAQLPDGTLKFTLSAPRAPGTYDVSYTAKLIKDDVEFVRNQVIPSDGGCLECGTQTPVTGLFTSKTATYPNGSFVQRGDQISYSITVEVQGSPTTSDTLVTDTLSPGLTYVAGSAKGSSFLIDESGAPLLKFTLRQGTPPGRYVVTYDAKVNETGTFAAVNNSVAADQGQCPTVNCVVKNPIVDAKTTKSNGLTAGQAVHAGQIITYRLTTEVSSSVAGEGVTTRNITLTDTLGPGLRYVPGSSSGDFVVNDSGPPTLTFTLKAGTPVGTYTVTYQAEVLASASASVSNGVTSDYGSCEAADCTIVNPISKVVTTKSSKPTGTVNPGDEIEYSLNVNVSGVATSEDVVLTDTLSPGLTYVPNSASGAGFTINDAGAPTLIFTLPAGAGVKNHVITYRATVDADAKDEVTNNVVSNLGVCDDCTVTNPISGIWVNKSASPAAGVAVRAGEEITYSLMVEVDGADSPKPVELTDTLGAGLTYKPESAAVSQGGPFDIDDRAAPILKFTLRAGAKAGSDNIVTYKAIVNAAATTSVSNQVVADGGSCVNCEVSNPVSGISTTKKNGIAAGVGVMQGQELTYTLEVTVSNAATSKDLLLSDTLGAGLEFVPGSVSGAGFTSDVTQAPELKFTLLSGAGVGTHAVSYKARVLTSATGTVANNVFPDAGSCEDCTVVNPVSRVTTQKSSNPSGTVKPGDEIEYALTVNVAGVATSDAVILTDTLSPGLTYVPNSASGAGFTINAAGAPTLIFTLPAGTAVGDHVITYRATVDADAQDEVTNHVVTNHGVCDDCTVINPISGIWVNKSARPAAGASVRAGEVITYSLLVEVEGADSPAPVELTDTLGAGLTYVPGSAKTSQGGPFVINDSAAPILRFTLPAGAKADSDNIVTYQATVNEAATTSVTNKVAVNGGSCVNCEVSNPVSGISTIKKNDIAAGMGVMEGQEITYTLEVTVADAATSKDLLLVDTLGEGLEFIPGSVSGAGFTSNAAGAPRLEFTLLSGADIGTHAVIYKARVLKSAIGTITNKVEPEAGSCGDCTIVNPVSNVVVKKSSDKATGESVRPEDIIRYRLTAAVSGAATREPVVLTDTLGEGLTYVNGSANGAAFTVDTSAAPVLVFTLPAGTDVGEYVVTYEAVVNELVDQNKIQEVTNSVVTNLGQCDECTTVVPVNPAEYEIEVVKLAELHFIRRGEHAPFTIRAINRSIYPARGVQVVDVIPVGFRYVNGTGTVDGVKREPVVRGRTLTFDNIDIKPSGEAVIRLRLLALSTAGPGKYTNVAFANNENGDRVSNEGRADIEILAEPIFDCGDVVGTVYDDRNRNGYRDDGEPGLPGVRVVTVNGQLITTDSHGRWHLPCAALPDQRIGSNFIAKVDERTLPTGYRMTSENPRVVRLTAGKMSNVDFGAAISRVIRLDLQDHAFEQGEITLKPEWVKQIDQLIASLKPEISVLRISYHVSAQDEELAEPRIRHLRGQIMAMWKREGAPYRLDIESSMEVGK